MTASPTSTISSSTTGGGAFDSPASGRTWGTSKDRGKIRLGQSHRLFRSLDVTASTINPPVQVDRLTDSPSSPPPTIAPTPHRWSDAAYYSLPHSSLWSTTFEDDEASLSCDSLDPSTTQTTQTVVDGPSATNQVSSPSPPLCPTPRKRWQSPAPAAQPMVEPLESTPQPNASQEEEFHPRFVCWELPFTPHRSGGGQTKPWVRVHPRMRSEVNPPAAHKCDLKAHRRSKPRSRPSSRERTALNATTGCNISGNGPDSLPDMSNRPTVKSKWTRRVNVQQLLPSKARFSSSSLDVRDDAQSGRGTRSHPQNLHDETKEEMNWNAFGMKFVVNAGMKGTVLRWNGEHVLVVDYGRSLS